MQMEKVYEGRGSGILGAHFCGTNSNTLGVCMMGNFEEAEASEAAKNHSGGISGLEIMRGRC